MTVKFCTAPKALDSSLGGNHAFLSKDNACDLENGQREVSSGTECNVRRTKEVVKEILKLCQ